MTEHEDVTSRLRALAHPPIDPAVASRHLTQMAVAAPAARPARGPRLRVAAAFAAGFLIGGAGLASAGVLGGAAQNATNGVLSHVGVPVGNDDANDANDAPSAPHENTPRYNGAECGTDADGNPWKNHGQYVKAHSDDPAAAESDCGKPLVSVNKADDEAGTEDTVHSDSADDDHGCEAVGHARGQDDATEHGQPTTTGEPDHDTCAPARSNADRAKTKGADSQGSSAGHRQDGNHGSGKADAGVQHSGGHANSDDGDGED